MQQELIKVVEVEHLEPTQSQYLLEQFTESFEQAKQWEQEARAIVITDASQVAEMEKARSIRLALKDIRVNAEKRRKKLKEDSLRTGKAIDGIANVIKALIEPIENYLQDQENFVELKIEAEKEELQKKRESALAPFVQDTAMYNLREMSEEGFTNLLYASKIAFEDRREAERAAEADREEKARKEETEREEQRQENARLKREKEEGEKNLAAERVAREKAEREKHEEKMKSRRQRLVDIGMAWNPESMRFEKGGVWVRESALTGIASTDEAFDIVLAKCKEEIAKEQDATLQQMEKERQEAEAKQVAKEYQEATSQLLIKFTKEGWDRYIESLMDERPIAMGFREYLEDMIQSFVEENATL